MSTVIYALVDPRSSVVRYVGKTVNLKHRLQVHWTARRRNTHLGQWLRILEIAGWRPTVLVLEPDSINWEADERKWIAHYKSDALINKTDGGEGVTNLSEEARKKIADKARGRHVSEETRRRLSIVGKNKKVHFSKTHLQNLTLARRARSQVLSETGRKNIVDKLSGNQYAKGLKHSPEARTKMSQAGKRRWNTKSYREKMQEHLLATQQKRFEGARKFWTGRKHKPETLLKKSESAKKLWQDSAYRIKNKGHSGKRHSEEAKTKMSKTKRQRFLERSQCIGVNL